MNRLKFSLSWRWASEAIVSKTMDDLPEPETPVKMVIFRLGMRSEMFFRLFSRAPRISMYSWGIGSPLCDFWGVTEMERVSGEDKSLPQLVRRQSQPADVDNVREQRKL
jgi:hypothetical protein